MSGVLHGPRTSTRAQADLIPLGLQAEIRYFPQSFLWASLIWTMLSLPSSRISTRSLSGLLSSFSQVMAGLGFPVTVAGSLRVSPALMTMPFFTAKSSSITGTSVEKNNASIGDHSLLIKDNNGKNVGHIGPIMILDICSQDVMGDTHQQGS